MPNPFKEKRDTCDECNKTLVPVKNVVVEWWSLNRKNLFCSARCRQNFFFRKLENAARKT